MCSENTLPVTDYNGCNSYNIPWSHERQRSYCLTTRARHSCVDRSYPVVCVAFVNASSNYYSKWNPPHPTPIPFIGCVYLPCKPIWLSPASDTVVMFMNN